MRPSNHQDRLLKIKLFRVGSLGTRLMRAPLAHSPSITHGGALVPLDTANSRKLLYSNPRLLFSSHSGVVCHCSTRCRRQRALRDARLGTELRAATDGKAAPDESGLHLDRLRWSGCGGDSFGPSGMHHWRSFVQLPRGSAVRRNPASILLKVIVSSARLASFVTRDRTYTMSPRLFVPGGR